MISLIVRLPRDRRLRVKRSGELFPLDGRDIELFTVAVFAEAVLRSVDTVKDWEARGLIPKPVFIVDESPVRMYADAQLVNANRLAVALERECPWASPNTFFETLRRIWYERTLVVTTAGRMQKSWLVRQAQSKQPGIVVR